MGCGMKLYRVVKSEDSVKNDEFIGVNTFDYLENVEYIHFFYLAGAC